MTADVADDDVPAHRLSAGRLGAIAGITPVSMLAGWIAISGWGGTAVELIVAGAVVVVAAVVAGWIVGGRLGRSLPAHVVGVFAYGFVAWLVVLPINVVVATWDGMRSGQVSGLLAAVLAAGGYLLYGALTGVYAVLFLLPFGAGWLATFVFLRRLSAA